LSLTEFTALIAMISAMVAFSIDSMLPAMGVIAAELSPEAPNRAQWIIASFFAGLGVGTLFAGPIADAIGRRATLVIGVAMYMLGAWLAWTATELGWILAARVLQGLGVAGPRVVAMAVTRDLYVGREMAKVLSLMMVVFSLVPAAAPLMGAWIMGLIGWRGIFLAFIVFAAVITTWFLLRQPETLPPAQRRPMRLRLIASGVVEVFSNTRVLLTILAQTLCMAMIVMMISTTQQVFDISFGRAESFPSWFAVAAIVSASSGFVNAKVVVRYGMRRVVFWTLCVQAALCAGLAALMLGGVSGEALFPFYMVWVISAFMTAGLTIGNLNALGMEPLGHMAGLGSAIITASATLGAVLVVGPPGALFDGTPWVQALTIGGCAVIGAWLTRAMGEPDPIAPNS
jgi:DHA1 family bicyclomycin/chloramphenicol resistance-like MFS transporter